MSKELNQEHAEVARTASERIHENIEHPRPRTFREWIGGVIVRAAEIIDISNVEEVDEEPERS